MSNPTRLPASVGLVFFIAASCNSIGAAAPAAQEAISGTAQLAERLPIAAPPTTQPTSQPTMRELQQARLKAAKAAREAITAERTKLSTERLDLEFQWLRRELECQLDLAETSEKRIEAFRDHLKSCERLAALVKNKLQWDALPVHAAVADYYVAQAKFLLVRAEKDPVNH